MTLISATNAYSAYSGYHYVNSANTTSNSSSNTTSNTSNSATKVTLSAAAKATLSSKSFLEVIKETRETLTGLLEAADSDSPYKDGELIIDMSGFDRRELFAIAGNSDGTFTEDEITAATNELGQRFDAALAGPLAVYKVTGNISKLYEAAKSYLEDASSEEKASDSWKAQYAAVKEGLAQLEISPSTWPDVENDPVTDYLARVEAGTAGDTQDFSTVAANARSALDQQIADAKAQGKSLNFSRYQKSGIKADFSDFSSRALSAIVLNEGDQFSAQEISAAKNEIDARARQVLLSCISNANDSSSLTALSENFLSAYGSLSNEERQAVGWGEGFYEAALTSYNSMSYIVNMFETSSSSTVTNLASLLS